MYESKLNYIYFFHKYLLKTYYVQGTTLSSGENTKKNNILHVSPRRHSVVEICYTIITEIWGHFSTAVAGP